MLQTNVSPIAAQDGQRLPGGPMEPEPKARKACINCRKQKMKCKLDHGNTCRRCQRSGVPCIFVPRANAPTWPDSLALPESNQSNINADIIRRLNIIEDVLGLGGTEKCMAPKTSDNIDRREDSAEDAVFNPLWQAVECLEKTCPNAVDASIWRRATIKHLWLTFHDKMPRLHFLPQKQTFSSPRPLLIASILYFSSARGSADVAKMAPHYFTVLCHSIARLNIPDSEIGRIPEEPNAAEEWAFQTVLGIILAGLLTEAHVREVGIWISAGYRLILEHCPPHADERSRKWRKLFTGIQIIDLEHASIHLSCPVIPIEAPLPMLRVSQRDQLYRLSRMMHTGLTHFTGRGLPTIWSCFSSNPPNTINSTFSFSAVDAAVIRDWARQLDEWLVEFSNVVDDTEQDRSLVFRQYVLHRLAVLSIYHPARGCNLYSNSITPKEQYELLLSARATLKLHINDSSIWSNWDLVMITWAALIVLQAIEGGAGEADDLTDIRIHLDMLRQTNEPKPSLRDKLIARLEQSLQGVQTPSPVTSNGQMNMAAISPDFDYSWQIFDQASLQQVALPNNRSFETF